MSLKKKLYTMVFVVGLMMTLAVFFNLSVVNFFVDDVQVMMDDTFSGHQFKETFAREVTLFEELMRERTLEKETAFKEACLKTEECLAALPFRYSLIGEERYVITWNIQNLYEQYCEQRQTVMTMAGDESGYVEELYTVYNMQKYLARYASRLNDAILTESLAYYEQRTVLLKQIPAILIAVSIAFFALLFWVVRVMTGNVVDVLSQLVGASKSIGENDYTVPDVVWAEHDEIGQLVCAFNKMKHATGDYIQTIKEMQEMKEKLYSQELEKARLEQKFSFAQLQLLKSQMNPHFLFNTLNMITRMAQLEDAHVSEEMLIALSNLLRYSLRTTEPFAPLDQEIKVVEDYMYIQKKRFGERVQWEITCQVDAEMEEIPVFLLQPLVENAIIHGISVKEEGGCISVRIDKVDEELHIEVADTGIGMKEERLREIQEAIQERGSGLGIGMGNIYRRLAAYYERREVSVDSVYGEGTVISMVLGKRKTQVKGECVCVES